LTAIGRGRWWRLLVGTIALLLLAPGSLALVSLSLAALLVAAGLRRPREYTVAVIAGATGISAVAWPAASPLGSALQAYTVIVAAAFACGVLVAPAGVWRQAWRATLTGIAALALLGLVLRGVTFWDELHWSVVRQASSWLRLIVQVSPDTYAWFAPAVRGIGRAYPVLVILQTLASLVLAWHWHTRLALAPLEVPVGASREPHTHSGTHVGVDEPAKPDGAVAGHRSMVWSTIP
jgi:hypothetical protein